jgi:hypothetical protein
LRDFSLLSRFFGHVAQDCKVFRSMVYAQVEFSRVPAILTEHGPLNPALYRQAAGATRYSVKCP